MSEARVWVAHTASAHDRAARVAAAVPAGVGGGIMGAAIALTELGERGVDHGHPGGRQGRQRSVVGVGHRVVHLVEHQIAQCTEAQP